MTQCYWDIWTHYFSEAFPPRKKQFWNRGCWTRHMFTALWASPPSHYRLSTYHAQYRRNPKPCFSHSQYDLHKQWLYCTSETDSRWKPQPTLHRLVKSHHNAAANRKSQGHSEGPDTIINPIPSHFSSWDLSRRSNTDAVLSIFSHVVFTLFSHAVLTSCSHVLLYLPRHLAKADLFPTKKPN
jgi:hypothetical protein